MADIVYPGEAAGGPLNADAMPANVNLEIYKGDYMELQVTVKQANDTPMNLTGYTPKAQMKETYDAPVAVEFDCTVTDAALGKVQILLTSTLSATLDPGDYIWDFQLTNASGTRTYLAGDVVVINEVTT